MDKKIGVREVAEIFGVSAQTIKNWAKKGVIPAVNRRPPGIRPKFEFREGEILKLAAERPVSCLAAAR